VVADALPEIGGTHRDLGDRLLEHFDLSRPPACLVLPGAERSPIERAAESLEGWLDVAVPLLEPREMTPEDWQAAGLVILAGGPAERWLEALTPSPQTTSMLDVMGEGSLVYAVGGAAESLGSWRFPSDGPPREALGWLPGGVILPGCAEPAELDGVTELLAREEHSYALGLAGGAVLALGPQSQVEVWGESRPTIVLGRGWRRE
jgi:hypothetical protein